MNVSGSLRGIGVLIVVSYVCALVSLTAFVLPYAASWQAQRESASEVASWASRPLARDTSALDRVRACNTAGESGCGALVQDVSGVIARLQVPSIGVDAPIREGYSTEVLERGVGHAPFSAAPVGGAGTRSIIVAHSGGLLSPGFTRLEQIKRGDMATVLIAGHELHYRVRDIETVTPEQADQLHPVAGEDLITFVTCTPVGIGTDRLVVTAVREGTDEVMSHVVPHVDVGFPWWGLWWLSGAAGLTCVSVLVWKFVRMSMQPRAQA